MRREKKPFQEEEEKKNPKPFHKATAPFGQREPCVSPRRASCNSAEATTEGRRRRWRKKNPLIHLSFFFFFRALDTQCDFAFTYILLSEISVRGNKQDPGGFVCRGVGAQRGAASDRANQSNKAHWQFSSVETGTEANHTSSEQRKKNHQV